MSAGHSLTATAPPLADAEAVHLADYDYALPPELIAQTPAARRDAARLMVVPRDGGAVRHRVVRELPRFLRPGDLLVVNDTRVRPARLHCRTASGGAVELLLLGERAPGRWRCIGRPAKRLRDGVVLRLPDDTQATVCGRSAAGRYEIDFGSADVPGLLARHGQLPLPPYIHRPAGPSADDVERYQTVFARHEGAVAAPTAGLHFTPELLAALDAAGVRRAAVTLMVGPGTFLPVRVDDVREHTMEAEWAEVPPATLAAIGETRASGGRVIAVGTTTVRALESSPAAESGSAGQGGGFWAAAFIRPGHRFQLVDGLLTNFHLPRSTLLMLVSALAGRERMLAAYREAVAERYRFYSYGDAMLIEP